MQTLEILDKKIRTANDLLSVVKTLKSLAVVNMRQFERAVAAIDAFGRVVDQGWQVFFQNTQGAMGEDPGKTAVIIIVGSDQGMCGRFNEIIVSKALEKAGVLESRGFGIQYWVAGEKSARSLADAGWTAAEQYSGPSNVNQVNTLVQEMIEKLEVWKSVNNVASFWLCHNRPADAGTYRQTAYGFLPLEQEWINAHKKNPWPGKCLPMLGLPGVDMFRHLFRQHLHVSLHRAFVHSLAAENAARLMAMQAAEKNILEMESEFRKSYREQRQMAITSELLDIMAGYEALSGSTKKKSAGQDFDDSENTLSN
jgi:F-type H+-transporting ATPase subunit gamma